MKFGAILLLFVAGFGKNANCQLPSDSVKYYFLSDSLILKYIIPNHFAELKNTNVGLVIYEPELNIISFENNLDYLIDRIGSEIYKWSITKVDTLEEGKMRIEAICPDAWGESKALFIFQKIENQCIILNRTIYDENGIEIISTQKILIEQLHLFNLVCLKEPTPQLPGTELPFIPINLSEITFATKEAFDTK